eukprot:SAG31_NODE_178_length_21247_cov_11.492009_11_plen_175_part_00
MIVGPIHLSGLVDSLVSIQLVGAWSRRVQVRVFLGCRCFVEIVGAVDSNQICCVATVGVLNEMLLNTDIQSGYLEFFPLWPHGEEAAFESLRAKGAFICSGSVGADGVVGDIRVTAEQGGNLSFVPPSSLGPPQVTTYTTGAAVEAVNVGGGVWQIATQKGSTYIIHGSNDRPT